MYLKDLNLVPAAQARPVDVLQDLYYEGPDFTTDGVVCAECSGLSYEWLGKRFQLRHATVDHVRYCHDLRRRMDDEAASELAAEAAVERFFEEGPHGPEDDPRERALWAMEDLLQGR